MKTIDKLRLRLDEAMRNTPRHQRDLYAMARWNGMAEMIALVAGTDATVEYNAAIERAQPFAKTP